MTSPSCPHKAQPGRQGRLIWITGPPALGKSTTAQLLSREHGYVYYEGDCFFRLRNPYIPPNVENVMGEGTKERWAIVNAGTEVWRSKLAKKEFKHEDLEAAYREFCKDVARERAKIGGE